MDTLCLEFESENENSYVAQFVSMHFNHTWAFMDQPSKLVDYKPLVEGVSDFNHILQSFSECTHLGSPRKLRLTKAQVIELDTFTCTTLRRLNQKFRFDPPADDPFMQYIVKKELQCSDDNSKDYIPIGSKPT